MKKIHIILYTFLFFVLLSPVQSTLAQGYTRDSLSMGPGYANDIYYSFANGVVAQVPRDNWDIAFYSSIMSAGIMVNQGAGVNLYTYPKGDTSAWATVDTIGLSTWPVLNNSPYSWEDGAFNANQKGHPDYGWGIYNMVTHNLTGDSLYVISLPDGSVKKLWIINKISIDNIYHFRYANIDGSDEQFVELNDSSYTTKNFAYYSIQNNEAIDREPPANTWDILFTKYIDMVPDNDGNMVPYAVTGATNNINVGASHFHPVAPDFNNWGTEPFVYQKNAIGAGWKHFDMNDFTYHMVDSTYYFVKTVNGDVYKLKFIYWDYTDGSFALDKKLISLASVDLPTAPVNALHLFPIPASNHVTIKMDETIRGESNVHIYDMNGRIVLSQQVSQLGLANGTTINFNLSPGLYFVKVANGNSVYSAKLLVQ